MVAAAGMVCLGMTDTVTAGTGVVCTSVVCVGAGTLIVVAIIMDGGCWLRVASAALAWVLFLLNVLNGRLYKYTVFLSILEIIQRSSESHDQILNQPLEPIYQSPNIG